MSMKFITAPSKRLSDRNNLAVKHPDIAAQWSDRNPVSPYECSPGSNFSAWWVCDLGHEYDAIVKTRTYRGCGCPYCANKRILVGFNDLATTHPEIARELFDEENGGITARDITFGSEKELWWKCDNDHKYKLKVYRRVEIMGCPHCYSEKILFSSGIVKNGNLLETHPEIARELCDEKNEGVTAENITYGMDRMLWWKCLEGHVYECRVSARTRNGKKCPKCYDSKGLVHGVNDFGTTHPDIASQLIDDKNDGITSKSVTFGSKRKLWWRCLEGHEYYAAVQDVVRGKAKCNLCINTRSLGEQELALFIHENSPYYLEINSRSVISPYELDMYIPEKNLAIEFNGVYWHTEAQGKDESYHYNKWKMCKDAGVDLVTVWEDDWRDRREVVETMLRSKLGMYDVNARDLTVVDVKTFREANMFFFTYDLYGSNIGNHTAGLVDDSGDVVVMLSWYCMDNIVYVDKYASSCAVEDGLSVLLEKVKVFARSHGCVKIVGMSDNEYSVDGVYELCGFDRVGDVGARCWKVEKNTRVLDGDDGGNNIWDCGRVRWECVV